MMYNTDITISLQWNEQIQANPQLLIENKL